jgi:hypothetical protein
VIWLPFWGRVVLSILIIVEGAAFFFCVGSGVAAVMGTGVVYVRMFARNLYAVV